METRGGNNPYRRAPRSLRISAAPGRTGLNVTERLGLPAADPAFKRRLSSLAGRDTVGQNPALHLIEERPASGTMQVHHSPPDNLGGSAFRENLKSVVTSA